MLSNRRPWSRILLTLTLLFPVHGAPGTRDEQSTQTYDYIVVGSGPGGGVAASQLAIAGNSVLLIEAGKDDTQDPTSYIAAISYPGPADARWAFFVNTSSSMEQSLKYRFLTWTLSDGSYWVGSGDKAPKDAKLNGVYYPRGATLGGSAVINAMGTILPNDANWDDIADITDDDSWT